MASKSSSRSTKSSMKRTMTSTSSSASPSLRTSTPINAAAAHSTTASSVSFSDDVNTSATSTSSSQIGNSVFTRREEKVQLMNLNDRLAAYINRVQELEAENSRLDVQMREFEEVETRERKNESQAYERECAMLRAQLDKESGRAAKNQVTADSAVVENAKMKKRLATLEAELNESERKRMDCRTLITDLEGRAKNAADRQNDAEERLKQVTQERDSLRRQLDDAQKKLELESLVRTEAENRAQSLAEELRFEKGLRKQEVEELKKRRETEIHARTREIEQNMHSELQAQLSRVRALSDDEHKANQQRIVDMYEKKVTDCLLTRLSDAAAYRDQHIGSANEQRQLAISLREQMSSMEHERDAAQSLVDGMKRKIADLEDRVRMMRADFDGRLLSKEEQIRALMKEQAQMLEDYRTLMDEKIKLDEEIRYYRTMLESEETRLNLTASQVSGEDVTQSVSVVSGSASRRANKRRRMDLDQDNWQQNSYQTSDYSTGAIEIQEHATDDTNFVRLYNRTDTEVAIGGWELRRVGDGAEQKYKFSPRQKIKAGASLTVWGVNAVSGKHAPPDHMQMKNYDWPNGAMIRTVLYGQDGDELAWRESKKTTGIGALPATQFNLDNEDQRCNIM